MGISDKNVIIANNQEFGVNDLIQYRTGVYTIYEIVETSSGLVAKLAKIIGSEIPMLHESQFSTIRKYSS